jgi:5-aminopentanamidase
MKVAAYQAPIPEAGSFDAVELVHEQLVACEAEGVEMLCCPEAILGGLADDTDTPEALALSAQQLTDVLDPIIDTPVTTIIGFTERGPNNTLFNSAAVISNGGISGIYRKCYPAIRQSVYTAGDELPVFRHAHTTFGIVICNDANYVEPCRVLASKSAAMVFMPLNNRLPKEIADKYRNRARSNIIARAVENRLTIVASDVTGHQGDYISYGASTICGPDGSVLASAGYFEPGLIIADVPTSRPEADPSWDGPKNPAVMREFLSMYEAYREEFGSST